MGKSQAYVIVVIPLSAIKKIFYIDIVGGTMLYYMILLPIHSMLAATIGSIIGPFLIRRSLKQSPNRK